MNLPHLDWSYHLLSTIFLLADLTIRIGLSVRVIMRKRSYGVSLAWLVVILLFPFIGAALYLLFGENRISDKRNERIKASYNHYQHWLETLHDRSPVNWQELNPECLPLHNLALQHTGLPAMDGNHLELLDTPESIISPIIRDIDRAKSTCHLQFYIWEEAGFIERVSDALLRATHKGVVCRILLDDIGSREFLASPLVKIMRESGIKIKAALPAGILKIPFARVDIRNHRKIIVIDGSIAYTGSQNMVDPALFKKDAGVGQWVDVMVRITGPVVETLAGTFLSDWFLETDAKRFQLGSLKEDMERVRESADLHQLSTQGDVAVQLVPSGPGFTPDTIHNLLLTTIYGARKELILTTPYLIPDDSLLSALQSAALRGVQVTLLIPEKNESKLAEYGSRARFDQLHKAGVTVKLFTAGFLHSKTITVDGNFALLGSVNLDMRSFWLNFETTLVIYNQKITTKIRNLQQRYIAQSRNIGSAELENRSLLERLKENAVLLLGPLL